VETIRGAMAVLSTICAIVGLSLGLRFKVLILVPAIGFAAAIIAAGGIAGGDSLWHLALVIAVATISFQVGYLGGTVVRHAFLMRRTPSSMRRERRSARNAADRIA
jgi:hypothetical protein